MQETHVRIGTLDDFAVHFQNQTQHTVRSRMLRTEIQRVIADFLFRFRSAACESLIGWMRRGHFDASALRAADSPDAVA